MAWHVRGPAAFERAIRAEPSAFRGSSLCAVCLASQRQALPCVIGDGCAGACGAGPAAQSSDRQAQRKQFPWMPACCGGMWRTMAAATAPATAERFQSCGHWVFPSCLVRSIQPLKRGRSTNLITCMCHAASGNRRFFVTIRELTSSWGANIET